MIIDQIRSGSIDDSVRCAEILNKWIDNTKWMPRLFSKDEILKMIQEIIPLREIWVFGEPVSAYLSFNKDLSQIEALYCDITGKGHGKVLLDKIKARRKYIQLWSHSPNELAHRFYIREGFRESVFKEVGDDGIPEIQFKWNLQN